MLENGLALCFNIIVKRHIDIEEKFDNKEKEREGTRSFSFRGNTDIEELN